ncbi:MAG: hypothetical protein CMG57_08600 [Candidatus Marinimicrobia bacterium]|nr:hypothetical protein [Candidatus Neomarinimicrobiota bacterium]|tara:strand:+ start:14469 stop:15293 length:825 start_codon:yes stop_codon:yes gene_type:complete
MSSIYRKGRDGYFYYQTYVYNPISKKKDKRIFHALATKDKDKAEQKQREFDQKYKFLTKTSDNSFIRRFFFNNQKTLFIVSISVVSTLFFTRVFDSNKNKDINSKKHQKQDLQTFQGGSDSSYLNLTDIKEQKEIKEPRIIDKQANNNISNNDLEMINNKKPDAKIRIPSYKIVRIEEVSSAFDQGKIFALIKDPFDSKGLRGVCDKIFKQYSKFNNIIICLYLDNKIGRAIASGKENDFTEKQKSESWLAMFSYNNVEGSYFDDSPGGYLGVF